MNPITTISNAIDTLESNVPFIFKTTSTPDTPSAYHTTNSSLSIKEAFNLGVLRLFLPAMILSCGSSKILEHKDECPDNDSDGVNGSWCGGNDCNDDEPLINPNQSEVCNGLDDNCNNDTDEGFTKTFHYRDADGDGEGNSLEHIRSCLTPNGYVDIDGDCNDSLSSVNSNANEICNSMDDDCNGEVDDGMTRTYYRDADDDGYGNPSNTTNSCTSPEGYVLNNEDCDDTDSDIHYGASENTNDSVDSNCNGYNSDLTVRCDTKSYSNIQEAIDVAKSLNNDQIIYLCKGNYNENVEVGSGNADSLKIVGEDGVTWNNSEISSNLQMSLTVANVNFDNSSISARGNSSSFLQLASCYFRNSTNAHGAIYYDNTNANGNLLITSSSFYDNESYDCCSGGAITFWGGYLHIQSSTFISNASSYSAAVISQWSGKGVIENSMVQDNVTSHWAGAVYLSSGTFQSINTDWYNNDPADVNGYDAGTNENFYCDTNCN